MYILFVTNNNFFSLQDFLHQQTVSKKRQEIYKKLIYLYLNNIQMPVIGNIN